MKFKRTITYILSAFPGFGQEEIPMILYNSVYAFLFGAEVPAAGWIKVPQGAERGGPWLDVSEEEVIGYPYFRAEAVNHP